MIYPSDQDPNHARYNIVIVDDLDSILLGIRFVDAANSAPPFTPQDADDFDLSDPVVPL